NFSPHEFHSKCNVSRAADTNGHRWPRGVLGDCRKPAGSLLVRDVAGINFAVRQSGDVKNDCVRAGDPVVRDCIRKHHCGWSHDGIDVAGWSAGRMVRLVAVVECRGEHGVGSVEGYWFHHLVQKKITFRISRTSYATPRSTTARCPTRHIRGQR